LSQYKNSLLLINEKITEFDNQNRENIKKIEKKYEKHLNEQLLINNKLKRQNEELINKKNEENIDSQRRSFKITELENELNNHKAMVEKLKMDLDKKNKENIAITDKNLLIVKNLNNFLLMLTKLKKKYLSIIFTLKTQINNIKDLYVNDISRLMCINNNNVNNNINILNNRINQLQIDNDELRDINEKMQIKLNQLIEENEEKNNNINQLNEELLIRQQKINNLHNVFNKSISSYSNGIKNIQIAQKLDNDVQELIEKAKNQMSTISNYNTDNL
jgi:chromosome segregation ATPase